MMCTSWEARTCSGTCDANGPLVVVPPSHHHRRVWLVRQDYCRRAAGASYRGAAGVPSNTPSHGHRASATRTRA